MAAVLRLKRKACDEPAEGLIIALKRPKCEENVNEVFFKFAVTVKSEKESIKNHIQAALSKEKVLSYSRWRDKKNAVRQKNVHQICQKLKAEHKAANEKKRLDLLNNRRLIFSETVPVEDDNEHESLDKDIEVRKLFQLYDIIEENEDVKKQGEELESIITCNNQALIREKTDYVYDVYIADVPIDDTFIDSAVCVRPYSLIIDDDIYFGDSEDSQECYEDEDDSNDENNWRNDYPDESDSDKDDIESDYDIHEYHNEEIIYALDKFDVDDDDEEEEEGEQYDSSRVLQELSADDEDD
ncbi:probable RNA polymerase II nuclear localization protein SLC7A6OS isoform X2 [Stegodyphus dumicola]|uniref:probable RNA polymerase II nuclear localization protein SLC7A6OS isoform X2 n=1 Tax=Stegodyphus dumicola TaxID=202533 RepID=UPI0015B2B266|nr:probable RNA polymerase II nuclear localization protein SLC7A6OS isoform X2 [Stegodyphus dumicola]